MRTCGAVQEHGISARDRHVERANLCLPILEGNVPAVHAGIHGRACGIGSGLGDGVVAIAKLELHNVTHCGDNRVWDESVLRATNNYGDDLVGAAVWADCN